MSSPLIFQLPAVTGTLKLPLVSVKAIAIRPLACAGINTPGRSDAGIAGIHNGAGDAGRGVGQRRIVGDGLAGGQREHRRRAHIGDKIALESDRRISPRWRRDGVIARIVRNRSRHRAVVGTEQEDHGIGNGHAVADHVAGELLSPGKIGDGQRIRERRREIPRNLEQIFPDDVLHEIAALKIQFGGDLFVGRAVRVARHVEIGHAANHHAGLAVGQVKLLHQQIPVINDAVGVEIQKFLHHDRARRRSGRTPGA